MYNSSDEVSVSAEKVPHERHSKWWFAIAIVVALAVVLPLTLFNGSVGRPAYLLGLYGPRVRVTTTGRPCRGAAASAASAVKVPPEADLSDVHLTAGRGGMPHWEMVLAAASKLGGRLSKLFPDQFAGMTVRDRNSRIDVYETCRSPNMSYYVTWTAPAGSVSFLFVPHTYRELNRAFGEEMRASLSSVTIEMFGVDVPANLVGVQVVNLTRQQLAQLDGVASRDLLQVRGIRAVTSPGCCQIWTAASCLPSVSLARR
jgi:hypothetical protein